MKENALMKLTHPVGLCSPNQSPIQGIAPKSNSNPKTPPPQDFGGHRLAFAGSYLTVRASSLAAFGAMWAALPRARAHALVSMLLHGAMVRVWISEGCFFGAR
jgi:hypothetical protein